MSSQPSVLVAGAGVLGLATAFTLARRGVAITLVDPNPSALSASAVAAGLLAPVGEALFDPIAAPHYDLMATALALWPDFAAATGIDLQVEGVVVPSEFATAAKALGAPAVPHPAGVLVQGDAQVADPSAALLTLRQAILDAGGRFEPRAVAQVDLDAHDAVVIAAGAGAAALTGQASELRHLTPVKGQIAVLPYGPTSGPVLRWAGGYLAPQPSGARVGATMEIGRDDIGIEAAVIEQLIDEARSRVPELDARDAFGQAGVRMQTPDGLPMVGPSSTPEVLLATGARRNGWLFAPLVAQIIAAYCIGEDAGPWADRLHPARFE